MRALRVGINCNAAGFNVEAVTGERQGLVRLVGKTNAQNRPYAMQQDRRSGIQTGIEEHHLFAHGCDVADPVGPGVPVGIRALAIPNWDARPGGKGQVQIIAVPAHAKQAAVQTGLEFRRVNDKAVDVEPAHR